VSDEPKKVFVAIEKDDNRHSHTIDLCRLLLGDGGEEGFGSVAILARFVVDGPNGTDRVGMAVRVAERVRRVILEEFTPKIGVSMVEEKARSK